MGRLRVITVNGLRIAALRARFPGSGAYWERRYQRSGTSGAGSYGAQAEYKAAFLNALVAEHGVASVIEWGCGDGNQLSLAEYPKYLGLDVSRTAVSTCVRRFAGDTAKSFAVHDPAAFADPAGFFRAELALSLDVIYHLIEDSVFDAYMRALFASARRLVVIYARDEEGPRQAGHVRHRKFHHWVEAHEGWQLVEVRRRARDDYQDFYVYASDGVPDQESARSAAEGHG